MHQYGRRQYGVAKPTSKRRASPCQIQMRTLRAATKTMVPNSADDSSDFIDLEPDLGGGLGSAAPAKNDTALAQELKQVRQELSEAKKKFESELKVRTADLEAARIEAEAASAAKGDFLATMSHEIRTPIHGIMGTLDLLADSKLEAEQKDYLHTARSSAESLLRIINDILDFSKIEAGKLTIERTAAPLRPLMEDCVSALAPLAFEKGVEVICRIDKEVPRSAILDPTRVGQVLTNLYGNAVKFTQRGQVMVELRRMKAKSGDEFLCFDVLDTGIGIEEDTQKVLFAPFTQADGSTTRKFGGTGLGLTISRRLAELMGGKIHLKSKPGKGSRFRLAIPLEHAPEAAQQPKLAPLTGRHVLIVDDNKSALTASVEVLRAHHALAEGVRTPEEAQARLKAAKSGGHDYHCALIDANMPSVSGLDLIKTLRGDDAFKSLPIGLMSPASQLSQEAEQLGVSVAIAKPCREAHLHTAVQTLLGNPLAPTTSSAEKAAEPPLIGQVLLVDDNANNRRIATAMIRKLGLAPDVAEDGAQAVEAVRENHYDLVLMDVQMPVMGGLDATRAIRELDGERRHVPIVALTANAMPEDREMCLQAGMDDYLPKPVRKKRLREVLDRWLTESARAQAETMDPADTVLRPPSSLGKGATGGGMTGLFRAFLDSLDARLVTLVEHYGESDFRALAIQSQAIALESRHVGAARLSALASLLEQACERGDYEAADRYARRLPRVARDTAAAIRPFLGDEAPADTK